MDAHSSRLYVPDMLDSNLKNPDRMIRQNLKMRLGYSIELSGADNYITCCGRTSGPFHLESGIGAHRNTAWPLSGDAVLPACVTSSPVAQILEVGEE